MDDVTKLDQLDKSDPELKTKTTELINQRFAEEKRKAELMEELKMQKAREAAKAKKEAKEPKEVKEVKQPPKPTSNVVDTNNMPNSKATPTVVENTDEPVTKAQLAEITAKINKSFAWLEAYVKDQNSKNEKFEQFIKNLTTAVNTLKK